MFARATLGNSLVAIVAGVAAQYAADSFGFVYFRFSRIMLNKNAVFRAPFDLSLTVLVLMCIILTMTWPENYGDSKAHLSKSFAEAWQVHKSFLSHCLYKRKVFRFFAPTV